MELTSQQLYQAGSSSLEHGPYHVVYQEAYAQRTYGIQEGRQHSDPLQYFQISEPKTKPTPQGPSGLPFILTIPEYEQNHNPNEMPQDIQRNRRSWHDGIYIQNSANWTSDHSLHGQQRHPQELDQRGPSATANGWQEQIYPTHNSLSNGLFKGNRVRKLEHGTPPPPPPPPPQTTSASTHGIVRSSYDGRTTKAPRTVNACTSCRSLKAKCSGHHPTCDNCKEKIFECIYKDVPPHKIEKTEALLTKIDVRTQEMEKLLQQLTANSKRTSMAEGLVQTLITSQHEPAVWRSHRTAATGILTCEVVRKIVGDVMDDEESAETIWREADLYMKHVNSSYPLFTSEQLKSLIQEFIRTNSIPHTTSGQSVGLKRKRPDSEQPRSPQLSIELALLLIIRALGKKYDKPLSPEHEGSSSGSPSGSTMFRNGYPTTKHVEKVWSIILDEHPCHENRISSLTPGSGYFDAATDIMAKHIGGSSLRHVQIYLLRHHYLFEAARALEISLQSNLKLFDSTAWDSTVVITFWTHRLLEGELLAERALSRSNLGDWEKTLPLPEIEQKHPFMIQLQFQNQLGAIDTELYQQKCLENLDNRVLDEQVALPNLYATVERLYRRDPDAKVSSLASNYAKRGIEILEYSIKLSNLFKDDPLITYAQWGNVMILLAAFSDVAVKHFIKHDLLKDLVSQTRESLSAWLLSALGQKYIRVLKDMALKTGLYQ
ncbi:uncharacterized protein RAG0_02784 [Rhynchosporium agropyri]|uniref:Zn(2)-C6 fungal-type domain-containing protein n=1 Tax=Rhynchosporium agropyri TaxID=914238 RepID=A0A1E1K3C3_9HELO|nr:uncharacterized protein RAG0_02784 [Rhynchosporium agropyri]